MISLLITVPEKLRYQIMSLIYEAQKGFYATFLFSPAPASLAPAFAHGRRKESERQTDRTCDIGP